MAPRDQLPLLAQWPSLQHTGEPEGDKGTHEWCNGHATLVQACNWELCTCDSGSVCNGWVGTGACTWMVALCGEISCSLLIEYISFYWTCSLFTYLAIASLVCFQSWARVRMYVRMCVYTHKSPTSTHYGSPLPSPSGLQPSVPASWQWGRRGSSCCGCMRLPAVTGRERGWGGEGRGAVGRKEGGLYICTYINGQQGLTVNAQWSYIQEHLHSTLLP